MNCKAVGLHRPTCSSVFARISTEISRQYRGTPEFFKIRTVSRKYGNCDVNDASLLPAGYRSLTFVSFKPFPGLKDMAGPD